MSAGRVPWRISWASGGRHRKRAGALPILLAGLVSLLGTMPALAAPAGEGDASDITRLYREGERLTYEVTYLGIRAGQATLEVRGLVSLNGQQAYHLVTTARTGPVISRFFRVDDRTESYVSLDPMRALRFEKHLREGRYRHSSRTEFDHERGVASFRYLDFGKVPRGISGLEEAERYGAYVSQEFPLTPGALDELSVLYYIRGLRLLSGDNLTAMVFAGKKNWELQVKVLGRESLDTVLGRRETVMVEPLLKYEGIFQQKGRMLVWITDDEERIPVRMRSEIVIGSFTAGLVQRETGFAPAQPGGAGGSGR